MKNCIHRVEQLRWLVVPFLLGLQAGFAQTNFAFYVAPGGSDANAGTAQAPFATLEQARDAVRDASSGESSNSPATIWVEDGTFYRTQTFQLGPADANLTIEATPTATPTATPRLCGGVRLDPAWFSPVPTNSPVWSRLDASARGIVLQVNLAAHGITNLGELHMRGMGGVIGSAPFAAELFCNDQPLVLGRWPNAGTWATVAGTIGTNLFTYSGTRPSRWLNAPDPWYHGYWYYSWADFALPGAGINTNTSTIALAQAPPSYGIQSGQPWFAYNLLEEIDTPGEYYIDRARQMLYVWPPANFASADLFLSQLDGPIINIQGGTNIVIDGLELTGGRSDLLAMDSACVNCEFRNGRLMGAGRRGAVLGGVGNCLTACEIADSGDAGVALSGGDRSTLVPGGNVVRDCCIHDFGRLSFTYTPGVQISGVGQSVVHNEIYSAPHSAILFSANNHEIAFNDIHDVCQWTSDAGAIYSGRDWGARGNRIEDNFIHNIYSGFSGSTVHAVYLDDCVSGIEVSSNVVYRVQNYALFNGGGRDNFYFNNVVARCGTFHYGDARGITAINNIPGSSWNLLQRIEALNYQQPPWSVAYPALAAIPDNYSQLGPYKTPGGVIFSRNLGWSNTTTFVQSGSAFSYYAQWTNNITNSNPLFVDEAGLDLTLSSNSPAFTIPGFGTIPFLAIGVGLPRIANGQAALSPPDFAAAQAWVDPKLDNNCVVQLCYGATDGGRTTTNWDHVITTNWPARGWVTFQVPAGANQSYVARFHAVNGEGESWSPSAFVFPTILIWDNGSGNGRWDTTSTNWNGTIRWNNTAPDSAIFGPAGAGLVVLAGSITASSLTFNSPGYTIADGSLTFAGTSPGITNNANAIIASVLTGTGGIIKAGPNTLALSGANTYSGGTTIAGGALTLSGGDNRLLSSSSLYFSTSGTLNLNGINQVFAQLTVTDDATGTVANIGTLALGNQPFQLGSANNNTTQTLNLSGLNVFSYNNPVNDFTVSGWNNTTSSANSTSGTLALAKTNTITATSFYIGHFTGNSLNGGFDIGTVKLGQVNTINADSIGIGDVSHNQGALQFQTLTNPALTIRGTAGGSARADLMIGQNGSGTQPPGGVVDLVAGVAGISTLDAMVGSLTIGNNNRSSAAGTALSATGSFTMGGGIMDATTIIVATDTAGTASSAACTAQGTFTLTNGTVKVATLTLGNKNSTGNDAVTGTFNLDGGGSAVVRNFNWNSGTISNYDANTDLAIGSGIIFTLAATGIHTFNTGTGRSNSVASVLGGAGGSLVIAGDGSLTLFGANTYSGSTTISNGTLLVNGSLAAGSTVTVQNDGTLGGNGTIYGAVTINGAIIPGTIGGYALSTGAETWNGGGSYVCQLNSTNNASPVGLNITGALNVQATSGNPFIIKPASFTVSNQPGLLTNFNKFANYTWMIAATGGGVSNFAANKFKVDASAFSNDWSGGAFVLSVAGGNLVLNYTAAPPQFSGISSPVGGIVQLGGLGLAGQAYVLQSTTNLTPTIFWTPLVTNVAGANGEFQFSDPQAINYRERFYRITTP